MCIRDRAQIVRTQFRNVDIVSRFGGDEFVAYAPGLTGQDVEYDLAGRIVDAISNADLGVTSSIGSVERVPFDLLPIESLVRKADRAMYSAKELGGNRFMGSDRL